jgi:hypothetical protein
MCFGCFMKSIYNGTKYCDPKQYDLIGEPAWLKLFHASQSDDYEDVVEKKVLDLLSDPDQIKYRSVDIYATETDMETFYHVFLKTIASLTLQYTVGKAKDREFFLDHLAIQVMQQIQKEIDLYHPHKLRPVFLSLSKNEADKKDFSYVILHELADVCWYGDSAEMFLNRPFVKYHVNKDPKNPWVQRIKDKCHDIETKKKQRREMEEKNKQDGEQQEQTV